MIKIFYKTYFKKGTPFPEEDSTDYVWNGMNQAAAEGQFPYQASLRRRFRGGELQHFCSGSILNKRWILTVAHCLIGYVKISAVVVKMHVIQFLFFINNIIYNFNLIIIIYINVIN